MWLLRSAKVDELFSLIRVGRGVVEPHNGEIGR